MCAPSFSIYTFTYYSPIYCFNFIFAFTNFRFIQSVYFFRSACNKPYGRKCTALGNTAPVTLQPAECVCGHTKHSRPPAGVSPCCSTATTPAAVWIWCLCLSGAFWRVAVAWHLRASERERCDECSPPSKRSHTHAPMPCTDNVSSTRKTRKQKKHEHTPTKRCKVRAYVWQAGSLKCKVMPLCVG